jgi:hypothetical protein
MPSPGPDPGTGTVVVAAGSSLGSGPCRIERSHTGHRHDRTDGVRPADGSAQGVQPAAPRQEKLAAHSDVSSRDAGVCERGVTQRRSAHGQANRRAPGGSVRSAAGIGGAGIRAGGLGVLLRGGRGGVCAARMPVCVVSAEDPALGGAVADDAVDRVAAHRRGRSVRVSLPAGRLGQSLPVRGLALLEEGQTAGGEPARAIPVVSIRQNTPIACS